jgi:hypothetical protein
MGRRLEDGRVLAANALEIYMNAPQILFSVLNCLIVQNCRVPQIAPPLTVASVLQHSCRIAEVSAISV